MPFWEHQFSIASIWDPCSSSEELPIPADPPLDKGGVEILSALLKEGQPRKQKQQRFINSVPRGRVRNWLPRPRVQLPDPPQHMPHGSGQLHAHVHLAWLSFAALPNHRQTLPAHKKQHLGGRAQPVAWHRVRGLSVREELSHSSAAQTSLAATSPELQHLCSPHPINSWASWAALPTLSSPE